MGVITNPLVLWIMGVLEWTTYHSANACIGLSPGIVEGIEKRGIGKDRVAMIPNGCDLDLFSSEQTAAKRPDGVNDTDLLAVFTGTHGIANGVGAALDGGCRFA